MVGVWAAAPGGTGWPYLADHPTMVFGVAGEALPTRVSDKRASGPPGSTLVHHLESASPDVLAKLKVGDHIPCGGSMGDLALANITRWCPVMNFVSSSGVGRGDDTRGMAR